MPSTRRRALVLALAGLTFSATAGADPRWWWNDIQITATATDSITPDLAVPSYAAGPTGGKAVFVVWSEADPVGGDLEIWMTATFDGGCTFCAPTRLTDNDVDDTNPRVAVLGIPTGFWSFGVAFESAGGVLIAWDSTTVDYRLPVDELCAEMARLGPTIVANDQYIHFGSPGSVANQPDISSAGTPAFGHFHAAWHQTSGGGFAGDQIWYAHDLIGSGGAGWLVDPPRMAPPPDNLARNVQPAIAADLASDPDPISGATTADRTGVNLTWVAIHPAGEMGLVAVRSADSGMTFSPTGTRADAPAVAVSDATPARTTVARPCIDAAFYPLDTSHQAWVAAAWQDGRGAGPGPEVWCDSRFVAQPAAPAPDWQAPDVHLATIPAAGDGGTSIALSSWTPGPSPAWIAWEDDRFGPHEISYRAFQLNAAGGPVMDLGAFAIPPARPLDPRASDAFQLSSCAFDPATFDCVPTRAAGDAEHVSIDSNEVAVYAVWSDSRFGQRDIFLKRTDRSVSTGPPRLTTGCGPAGDAWVDVEFDLVATCPVAAERMVRYLIYYGTTPGGPYDNAAAPIVVPHDPAAGPTVIRRIAGLVPGTTYSVVVVPEDEARNVYPSDFDPAAGGASPRNEASVVAPAPCVPQTCLWRSDVTSLLPHVPSRAAVYLVPPAANDISLEGASYQCPFADGDLEQDANAVFNGVPLVLYQVNLATGTLRLAKAGATIRFDM